MPVRPDVGSARHFDSSFSTPPGRHPHGSWLWGTSQYGGASGYGMVYAVTVNSPYTLPPESSFDGSADGGGYSYSGLTYDPTDQNFYGTTNATGAYGGGSIFAAGAKFCAGCGTKATG